MNVHKNFVKFAVHGFRRASALGLKLKQQVISNMPKIVASKPLKKIAKKDTETTMTSPQKVSVFKALLNWAKANKFEAGLLATLLIISVVAHAWNMFGFPYFENDEATYASRAWTFITDGRLDVYTYRYDHAPLGWMLLGAWQLITAGTLFFGSLLESGRAFMLLIHTASTLLVYILAKRFSGGSKLAGTVAVLFFALSPIGIFFQRRILLDNIMTFWLLLSLYFATKPVARLKNYVLSGLALGVAVLTKLNAIFFAPAILLIVWVRSHKKHRLHATAYWLMVTGMVVASFFLYALLKGELFPAPLDGAGNPTHVSVVDTFALQLGRGEFAFPWNQNSSFWTNVESWLLKDWSILVIGAASTIALALVSAWRLIRRRAQPLMLALVMLIFLYVAFLARGKIVLDLYIVPLLPLLAMAIGVFAALIHRDWLRKQLFKDIFVGLVVIGIAVLYMGLPDRHFWRDETSNQKAAVAWIKQHVPEDAVIATDNYLYPYLAQEGNYKNVSYFFTAEYDPEIRKTYDDEWRNIDYLVLTHEVIKQIKTGTVPRMKQVLDHAVLLADYRHDTSSYVDLPNYISTNGDWVQVYKIKDRNNIVLQDSWQHFKSTFVVDYGQVVDLTNGSLTSSGGQAQAMVRAVREGDQAMFTGLWQWSKDHLRYRAGDTLLSWKWELQPDGTYKLGDSNTVCDADQQIAYALFMADEKWSGKGFGDEARVHVNDWWRKCVFERGGRIFVDSSADGSQDIKLVNPGYFRPAMYAYFAERAPDLQWQRLIDDGYVLLEQIYAQYRTIPNWAVVGLDGSVRSAASLVGGSADSFGYDALQLVPNLAEAYALDHDERALATLRYLQPSTDRFAADANSAPAQAARLLLAQIFSNTAADKAAAQSLYESAIHDAYSPDDGYWYIKENYFDQVWLWYWHDIQNRLDKTMQVKLR